MGAADNGKNIIPFDGESLVYDGAGRLVAIGRQFEEDLLVVDLDAARRPPLELPPDDPEREMYDALVMSLRDYMRKTGFTRAVVPVSGGIDSALALAIAADALGPGAGDGLQPAVEVQHRHDTVDRASGWRTRSACATPSSRFRRSTTRSARVFEGHAHPMAQNLTRENLHARIRGILMMAESNDTGALLISCGNETEIALGYATLYGDMCGGMSLIGDLSKTDVYALSRYVNRKHGREMIPAETFTIKPSAELAAGQFDPFDYAVVAPIVAEFVEHRTSPGELVRQFERRALDPARFKPDDQGRTPYDKLTRDSFRADRAKTPSAGCAAPSTSACRARPSSSSARAPSASICAKRSSTAWKDKLPLGERSTTCLDHAAAARPLPDTAEWGHLHCSFCGKDGNHVRFLTAGVAGEDLRRLLPEGLRHFREGLPDAATIGCAGPEGPGLRAVRLQFREAPFEEAPLRLLARERSARSYEARASAVRPSRRQRSARAECARA